MKLKNSFFYTLREDVKNEDSKSGNLLARGGFIKKTSAGVYMLMPLGHKVNTKIQDIIRKEMNKADSQELTMPALIAEEYYVQSNRRDAFGNSMFSLKDRFNKPFCLGPTHEELFTLAAGMKVQSYKDLPFSLYQFQTKFRDEPRPRYGLIRVREFTMKDAYSFDTNLEGLDISYNKMFNAYKNSFDKMGIDYKIVKADTGNMGGMLSEEFQAITEIGEDIVVLCDKCDLSSNIEVAECHNNDVRTTEALIDKELVHTPNAKTIEEVAKFLNIETNKLAKTLIYKVDNNFVACMVAGNREVNETKIKKLYNANEIELASPEDVTKITNAKVGFAGPIGLNIDLVVDKEVYNFNNITVGANKDDYHYINVNSNDYNPTKIEDIRNIMENDICPKCGGNIHFKKGIEVGNTFKLGTKYSEAMGLNYSDSENKLHPVVMGSYGIGTERCMAAIVEQNSDENGINWPINVAPYQVAIILISDKDEKQVEVATNIYNKLTDLNYDVILDDRDERAGVKFKDMELIGIPYRITVGKAINDNNIEFKARTDKESTLISIDNIIDHINNLLK